MAFRALQLDANGKIPVSALPDGMGTGTGNVLVLGAAEAVPPGTPANTVIVRKTA